MFLPTFKPPNITTHIPTWLQAIHVGDPQPTLILGIPAGANGVSHIEGIVPQRGGNEEAIRC